MDVAVHLVRPNEKTPQVGAFGPEKLPEFEKADLRHLDAGVGFNSPEKIRAAPRRETVPTRRVPEKAEHVTHWFSVYRHRLQALGYRVRTLGCRLRASGVAGTFARDDRARVGALEQALRREEIVPPVLALPAADRVERSCFLLHVLAAAAGAFDFLFMLLKCENQLEGLMTVVADVIVYGHGNLPKKSLRSYEHIVVPGV
jgi:hypothetical protein